MPVVTLLIMVAKFTYLLNCTALMILASSVRLVKAGLTWCTVLKRQMIKHYRSHYIYHMQIHELHLATKVEFQRAF